MGLIYIYNFHSLSYYFSFKINCSESYFTVTQLLLTLVLTDSVHKALCGMIYN